MTGRRCVRGPRARRSRPARRCWTCSDLTLARAGTPAARRSCALRRARRRDRRGGGRRRQWPERSWSRRSAGCAGRMPAQVAGERAGGDRMPMSRRIAPPVSPISRKIVRPSAPRRRRAPRRSWRWGFSAARRCARGWLLDAAALRARARRADRALRHPDRRRARAGRHALRRQSAEDRGGARTRSRRPGADRRAADARRSTSAPPRSSTRGCSPSAPRGRAVLLVSAELQEILALSDRVLVMYEGRIVADLPAAQADEATLGLLMAGRRAEAA